jgi:hypothetical protein
MSLLLRILIVTGLFQLSWWKASEAESVREPLTAALLLLGMLGCVFSWAERRFGMGLAGLLALGYLGSGMVYAEVVWHDLPLSAWAGLVLCSTLLHGWVGRRRQRLKPPGYQRVSTSSS